MSSYCVVIPHFNHHQPLAGVLGELEQAGLPVIVVDDGSAAASREALRALASSRPWLTLVEQPVNAGKGAAFLRGMQMAARARFTHAVQIDADGQHDVADLSKLVAESREHPHCIVSGLPLFGDDIPPSRLHGRKMTLWLARVETLSMAIRDAMCGYRVYPVAAFLALCGATRLGRRMDFDAEVLVKACWRGQDLRFVPTRVRYPPGGVSHFRLFRDNVDMTLMHLRLIGGMLWRFPRLLARPSLPAPAEGAPR
jgi:glycosyltransferase involved in cell wall biosynthesis